MKILFNVRHFVRMNAGLSRHFGSEVGVLVLDVKDHPNLGLEAGDVILAIEGRDVSSATQVVRILNSYDEDEEARISIIRQGQTREIVGTTMDRHETLMRDIEQWRENLDFS